MKILMRTNITKMSMELFQSPKKYSLRPKYPDTFLVYRFNQSVQSPTCHLELIWRRKYFCALEQLHGSLQEKRFTRARILHAWTITKRTMPEVSSSGTVASRGNLSKLEVSVFERRVGTMGGDRVRFSIPLQSKPFSKWRFIHSYFKSVRHLFYQSVIRQSVSSWIS